MLKRKYVVLSLLTLVSILLGGLLYCNLVQAQSTVKGYVSVYLTADNHQFRIDYYENGGDAEASFSYTMPTTTCDSQCKAQGFSSGVCRTGGTSSSEIDERKTALLTTIANKDTSAIPDSEYWEENTLIANVRIWLNYRTTEANNFLKITTDVHGTDKDGAVSGKTYPHPYDESGDASNDWDFVTTHIITAYFSLKDNPNLSSEAKTNMKNVITNRAGVPFDEFESYYSENHDSMIAHSAHFANILKYGSDDTFNVDYLSWFMDNVAKKHYEELNSPTYMATELRVLYNIYEYSNNDMLKKKAEMLLDMLMGEQAVIHLNGIRGGPFYRYYDDQVVNQANDYMYTQSYIYFGTPNPFVWRTNSPLSSYIPPNVILDIAKSNRGSFEFRATRLLADTYYYVTPNFVLASAQGKLSNTMSPPYPDWGMAHQWDLSFDTSPKKLIYSETRGSVQHKNVLITVNGPINYVGEPYDEKVSESGWTFVREGGTYVAIRSLNNDRFLLEVRLASDYSSFTAFKDDIKDNSFSQSGWSVTYYSTLGDKIESPTRFELKVNDVYQSFSYKLFDSPYINSDWNSGYIVVEKDGRKLILDFRDTNNPIKTVFVTIPGDFDGDDDVDIYDFWYFTGSYLTSPPADPRCDFDGDGDVDIDDFYIFTRNYLAS